MSFNYFEVGKGLAVFNESNGTYTVVTQGSGTTAISGAPLSEFPLGSIYTDTTTGKVYTRTGSASVGIADWGVGASEQYVTSQMAVQVSWREPALVRDNTFATIAAAQVSANTSGSTLDKIDGVTISAGKRILFTGLSSGNKNVYIVSGTSGSWVFTEDTNLATDGDSLYITSGTDAGKTITYSTVSGWVITGAASETEIGYIRTFIGKSAGNDLPNYSSTTNITQNTSLEAAIGVIDGVIGTRTFATQEVVTNGQTIAASLAALDYQFGTGLIVNTASAYPLTSQTTWNGGALGAGDLTTMLNNLNNAIGNRQYTNSPAINFTLNGVTTNYASVDAEPISATLEKLTVISGINAIQEDKKLTSTTATTAIVVSAITVNTVASDVHWNVMVREHGAPSKIESVKVHAVYDGATGVDFSVFARQRTGGIIAGLTYTVIKSGNDLQLKIQATNPINYVVQRISTLQFA